MLRLPSILLFYLSCQLLAHESPSHSLELLNQHIAEKPTPELYFQRALAYKALGKLKLAAIDLTSATKARPDQLSWKLEKCRIQLARNLADAALRTANRSLRLAKNNTQRADVHILRAQAYHLSKKPKPSLQACQLAFKEIADGKMDWFLLRSENQLLLGLHKQRILGLEAGLKTHPNSILKAHYVDALIDAGRHTDALAIIDQELPTLRWQSHWQVKQARSLIALNRKEEAKVPLESALQEITQRINPTNPDIHLVADRAMIELLTEDQEAAKASLTQLRRHRAPKWLTSRIESRLIEK